MRDGWAVELDFLEALAGDTRGFLTDHASLALPNHAHGTFLVSGNDESGEAEATSTFTTLEQRLTKTTFSVSSLPSESVGVVGAGDHQTTAVSTAATATVLLTATVLGLVVVAVLAAAGASGLGCCIGSRFGVFVISHIDSGLELEFKTTFAGGIGKGLDLASEEEASAVEDHGFDFGVSGTLGYQLSDSFGCSLAGSAGLNGGIEGGSGAKGLAGHVIDDLGVDVLVRKMDGQTRAIGSSGDLLPDAAVHLAALFLTIKSAHCLMEFWVFVRIYFTDLPALRRTYSST